MGMWCLIIDSVNTQLYRRECQWKVIWCAAAMGRTKKWKGKDRKCYENGREQKLNLDQLINCTYSNMKYTCVMHNEITYFEISQHQLVSQ